MGMDIYGLAPTTEQGKYLRHAVWSWHPIAECIEDLFPTTFARCKHWHTNDGDGLDDATAEGLAIQIKQKLDSGEIREYVQARRVVLDALPDEVCRYCAGTGVRRDKVGVEMGMDKRGWCNGCDGKGKIRPFSTHYVLEEEYLQEFADFLMGCGGFEIR